MWDRRFDGESRSCRCNSGFIGAMWASYPAFSKGNTAQNKKNLFYICAYTDVKQVLREHRIKLVRKICKQIAYKAVRRALFCVSVRKKWESALME